MTAMPECKPREGARRTDSGPAGVELSAQDAARANHATSSDSTVLTMSEGKLWDNEKLLRQLLSNSHDCVKILDLDGRLLWMNACGLRSMEIENFALLQHTPWLDLWKGEDHHAACAAVAAAAAGRGGSFTGYCPTTKGAPRWWDIAVTPIPSPAKQPERLLAISRDITGRKQMEVALRDSEKRHRQLVENSPDAIILHHGGQIAYANPAAFRLIGNDSAGSMLGRTMLDIVHPDYRRQAAERIQSVTAGNPAPLFELKLIRLDGSAVDVESISIPVTHEGQPAVQSILRDITARKNLETQFLRAQRMENIGLLAAGIAHDLNNILSPLMMLPGLLRAHLPAESDQRMLAIMEQSARRGAGLVKQILSFAHGTGDQMGPVPLTHIARDIAALVEETFPRNLRFTCDIAADLWPAHANAGQIHQVLLNLCINARDAMPAGGELRLRVANFTLEPAAADAIPAARPGEFILLEVADTGTGIPPELQERVWEPFFTTKSAGKGTGLGLSTIRGIISRHHGFGTLESAVGHGTTFRFYVPATHEKPVSGSRTPFDDRRAKGETILIVDDEPDVRVFISAILTQHGYQTLTAGNGPEALGLFATRTDRIAMIITDVHMPGISGTDLTMAFRQLRADVRILLCTGLPEQMPAEARPEGILLKPFEADTLLTAARRLLPAE
ncbi:MAG: PAS domain S-box protein [Opitutae bacterium]|nr:PAS domain S-box protein [Opitutae bacterium]